MNEVESRLRELMGRISEDLSVKESKIYVAKRESIEFYEHIEKVLTAYGYRLRINIPPESNFYRAAVEFEDFLRDLYDYEENIEEVVDFFHSVEEITTENGKQQF
jgi:hypothetical protein